MQSFLTPDTIKLVQILGFGVIVFIIWILTLRFFNTVLAQQQRQVDRMLAMQSKQYGDMIAELSKRNSENFEVLNKFAESFDFVNGVLSNIDSDIKNNNFCPVIRERKIPQ